MPYISQETAQKLLAACFKAVEFAEPYGPCKDIFGNPGESEKARDLVKVLNTAIKAAWFDETKHIHTTISGAKADALKAAREVDRKAQRVTDHRFLEQNGG